jgi:hypothetical protein
VSDALREAMKVLPVAKDWQAYELDSEDGNKCHDSGTVGPDEYWTLGSSLLYGRVSIFHT